jgi:hypothetical protein
MVFAIISTCGKNMVKKITKEGVKKFMVESLTLADNSRFACCDGRVKPEQSKGAVRAFGADMGPAMALAATVKDTGISLSPGQFVDRYWQAVSKKRGLDGRMYIHTDKHHAGEGQIGCAHVAKAADPANDGRYGSLSHDEVLALYRAFVEHPRTEIEMLDGEHREQAVIFVDGESDQSPIPYSVHSQDDEGNMYFVVDEGRIIRFIDKATAHFSEGLPVALDPVAVRRNLIIQMEATTQLLAADLDKFRATISPEGSISVDKLSKEEPGRTN